MYLVGFRDKHLKSCIYFDTTSKKRCILSKMHSGQEELKRKCPSFNRRQEMRMPNTSTSQKYYKKRKLHRLSSNSEHTHTRTHTNTHTHTLMLGANQRSHEHVYSSEQMICAY